MMEAFKYDSKASGKTVIISKRILTRRIQYDSIARFGYVIEQSQKGGEELGNRVQVGSDLFFFWGAFLDGLEGSVLLGGVLFSRASSRLQICAGRILRSRGSSFRALGHGVFLFSIQRQSKSRRG